MAVHRPGNCLGWGIDMVSGISEKWGRPQESPRPGPTPGASLTEGFIRPSSCSGCHWLRQFTLGLVPWVSSISSLLFVSQASRQSLFSA